MQSLKGKKLLFMSGSKDACEIVKIAQELGIIVYATDWYRDSPVKHIADKSFMVSTADVDAIVELCKTEGIDGIFSGYTDSVLPYCQAACEKLGLPFWGTEQNIQMCIDKKLFKKACEDASLPIVPYVVMNESNYLTKLDDITVPVVFKPVDNSGSRGVYKVFNDSEVKFYCEKSLSYSKSKEILAEKLMDANNEFSAYYMLNNGNAYLTAMADKIIDDYDQNLAPVDLGMRFPSQRLKQWLDEIDPIVRDFFSANQMKYGFVFIQGFYMDGKFHIHEIGYRLNGGFTYKLVEHFSHYSQVEQLLSFALTGKMNEFELQKSNPKFNGISIIVTATLRTGTIGKIDGVDFIKKLPGVIAFYQMKEVGDELSLSGTTAQIFSYIHCVADNVSEMQSLINKIKSHLVVCDVSGNNMLLPLIDEAQLD